MRKPLTKSAYEAHNIEIINNNFPERMNVLIPCDCGKEFKAQDGHFVLRKDINSVNQLSVRRYKGFTWICKKLQYERVRKYNKNNPEKRKAYQKFSHKGNKYSFSSTINATLRTQKKRFPDKPCIFKDGGKFPSSLAWKEANEHNRQVINNLLEKQNYKCALTGDPINELTASIDRIDSNHGYIEGNIQLLTTEANYMKKAHHNNEFIDFCTKVYLHTQSKKFNSESSQDLDLQSTCIPPSESSEILEE